MVGYVPRSLDAVIGRLLGEVSAIMLTGPRATGKTTTGLRHARSVLRLDRPAEAEGVAADADAVLRDLPEPVLVDEWQSVPDVLGAVKRAVDTDPRPGRFLVTGSVRGELTSPTWPGTGRLVRVPMQGLTVREQLGRLDGRPLLDRLVAGGVEAVAVPADVPDLRGYVDLALAGGFPDALAVPTDDGRARWLASYVEQLVTRDAVDVGRVRDPVPLSRFLQAVALHSAGVVADSSLARDVGVSVPTVKSYDALLSNLLVVDALPAWWTNRLKRLTKAPKRYFVDAGLMSGALGLDADGVLRDGNLLGRVLDTFVVSQVRAELPLSARAPRLFHLRREEGSREVDLIGEFGGGRVVAVEIKARAAPRREDFRHLEWLRDELGDRFQAGLLLHTGPRAYVVSDRVSAAPICSLWA
ncbi:MAG: ATP-binding protein [Kineosporiaceae bacterium]